MTSSGETITCRRCDESYLLPPPPRPRLLACPHCGASPQPLLVGNRAGAVVAFVALVILTPAVFLPFISTHRLGTETSYSLGEGIWLLMRDGGTHLALGLLLFLFSLVFPFTKLLSILAATSAHLPFSKRVRQRILHVAEVTGKYSLLDVLVVAILVVVIKMKGVASVSASSGTILFAVAIVLSLLAGFLVSFDHLEELHHE